MVSLDILWILVPAPFVGYLLADSVRKIFSDDDQLLRKVVAEQPVTMIASLAIVGSLVVWTVVEVARGLL
jgi:hypothetical protein